MKSFQGTTRSFKHFFALTAVVLFSGFLFQSCKKDRVRNDQPSLERNLVVSFANGAIPFAEVDSANITMTKQGSNTAYFRRFDKGTNSLDLVMDDNLTGNWTASITIYTKKSADGSSRMYTRSVGLTLPLNANQSLSGPTNDIQGVWKPHIVLASANNEVVAVISADNGEPYFDIRVKDSKWDHFYVERAAHNRTGGMNELIAADSWECAASCYTNDKLIINSTAFANFSNLVKTKTWNNGEILIILADEESGDDETFFYMYNKN